MLLAINFSYYKVAINLSYSKEDKDRKVEQS